jgi:flagellar motor switch/type III secretory pathway protein FliN
MEASVETERQLSPKTSTESGQAELSAWQPAVHLASRITPRLADVIQHFWGLPVRLRFFSVSLESHYYWRQDDFHVSQLVLGDAEQSSEPAGAALLRISDTTCASLLEKVLGSRQKPFNFKQISPLEAAILNDFSRDLLACLMKGMLRKVRGTSTSSPEQAHFIWNLQIEGETGPDVTAETGRIVLSVPPEYLRLFDEAPMPAQSVPDDFFFHVLAEARIRLGRARLPLAELNALEPGDWVVLDDSDTEAMALVDPHSGEALSFLVEIAQRQRLIVPYTQELAIMDTEQAEARQNLWDNLMIDVNAEFAPVKLPLKQLKQMSEGLIVEVGDLVQNQIALQVEGKTLAWGELIIVGDKFGVRVTKVEAAEDAEHGMAPHADDAPDEDEDAETHEEYDDEEDEDDEDASDDESDDNDEDLDNFLNEDFEDDEEDW